MNPVLEAVRSGSRRGARLALNPTVENYRSIRTPRQSVARSSWNQVGNSIRLAMKKERPTPRPR